MMLTSTSPSSCGCSWSVVCCSTTPHCSPAPAPHATPVSARPHTTTKQQTHSHTYQHPQHHRPQQQQQQQQVLIGPGQQQQQQEQQVVSVVCLLRMLWCLTRTTWTSTGWRPARYELGSSSSSSSSWREQLCSPSRTDAYDLLCRHTLLAAGSRI